MENAPILPDHLSKEADCVVLLHGLGRTAKSMGKLEQAFCRLGYRVVNLTYPSRKHSIEKLSQLAIDHALDKCRPKAKAHVHFVTHSLGGILVRYYLENAKVENLGRVVMIAPPNKGSQVVDKLGSLPGFEAINGPACMQLGTDSESIPSKLGAVTYPVGVIAGTRSVSLILSRFLPGANDGKVTTENTKVEGMSDYIEMPVPHPFIMQSAKAIHQATNYIRTGTFRRVEKTRFGS